MQVKISEIRGSNLFGRYFNIASLEFQNTFIDRSNWIVVFLQDEIPLSAYDVVITL